MNPFRWATLVVIWLVFFAWYTSFEGPLSDAEIAHYAETLKERGVSPEGLAVMREFLEGDTGDDFVMVNAIELREPPTQVEGVEPGETASQVMDRYMAYMWPALLRRACHPVMFGLAAAPALDLWGLENAEVWSQAGMMRYRSRRDMMEIAANPDFQGPHEFKIAAMTKTIAFPIDPWMHLGDPRLLLALALLVIGLLPGRRSRRAPRRR